MTVLIVDDNEKVRELMRDYLPTTVEQVYECGDGDAAFALYQQHHPDWVLMDWQMPNTDGITAIREIIAEYPLANICLVTSFEDDFLKSEALEAGAKYFVLKRNLSELQTVLTDELAV